MTLSASGTARPALSIAGLCGGEHAGGGGVAQAEDRGRLRLAGEHFSEGGAARRLGQLAVDDVLPVERQAQFLAGHADAAVQLARAVLTHGDDEIAGAVLGRRWVGWPIVALRCGLFE